jgi:4-hydroxy-4-methyl-2-oxoglutarate aldolase
MSQTSGDEMSQDRDQSLVARLATIPYTGAISDILVEMGLTEQVLPPEIQSISPGQTLAGRAFTLLGEVTSSIDPDVILRPFLRMLGELRRDHVLVTQSNDSLASHLGELSSETAQYRGARGAVIDGGVRDVDYIIKLGFPVFARYKTPRDVNGRWRLADYNVPIKIGSVGIKPGDYVVGDLDGVVVIPQDIAEEVVAKAESVVQTENLVRRAILEGVHPLEAFDKYGKF